VAMTVDAGAARIVADRLARAGVEPGDPVIVIHVSAGNPFRRWPMTAFVALIAALVTHDPRAASSSHRDRRIGTRPDA